MSSFHFFPNALRYKIKNKNFYVSVLLFRFQCPEKPSQEKFCYLAAAEEFKRGHSRLQTYCRIVAIGWVDSKCNGPQKFHSYERIIFHCRLANGL
jgi:hypothetical protein